MDISPPSISPAELAEKPWLAEDFKADRLRYEREIADALQPVPLGVYTPEKRRASWIVEGLLPANYLTILAGEPKVGKTSLATAIALSVATGTPFAGSPVRAGSVVWVCFEESWDERTSLLSRVPMAYRDKAHTALLTQVAGRVLASPETAHYIPLYNVYHRIPIDTDDGIRVLFDLCRAVEAVLLVIDPLHAAHSGRSLQDGWAARRTLSRLKDLAGDKLGPHGPTVLVTHHAARRGPSRVAENAQLAACASQFLIMKSQNDASESQRQVTLVSKGRLMEVNRTFRFLSPSPLEYQGVESFSTQIAEMTHPAFALPPKPIEKAIVDALYQWPMTPNDLADELGYSPSAVGNTLTRLVRHGKIAVIGKVGRAREYDLRDEVRTAMSATEPKKEEKEDKG